MVEDKTLEIVERLTRIETMLQSDVKALEDRVNKLEGNYTWLTRTVGGLVIGAIMALVLVGNKI